MKINYDNINIPDENLNKVVSESLETVKNSIPEAVFATSQAVVPLLWPLLPF